jgi:hypothetical protein
MDPARSGGGELIDQGVHLIDLAASFLGEFLTVDGHAAIIYEFPRGDTSSGLELNEFLEDINLNRTPSPGLREGRRVLEIVERIYENSGYRF